jgi:hypothetical protein
VGEGQLGSADQGKNIMVPERSIGTDQDKKFVMVVGADNKVSVHRVEVGASAGDKRIVLSGLDEGDKVVVTGLQRIKDGVTVVPKAVGQTGPTQGASAQAKSTEGGKPNDAAKPTDAAAQAKGPEATAQSATQR